MNLPIPIPSQTSGPQYALDEQSCFTKIDAHNHSPNKGAPIPLDAISVSSNFDMNDYGITNLKYIALNNQTSSPASGSLYMKANNLWWTSGTGAYDVQITVNGGVNVTGQTGFVGLPSGTASAVYLPLTGTFKYESATNIAATLDVGPIKLRNTTVSSNYVGINAPNPLASNYNLTLPPSLPAATKILQVSSTGDISATLGVDNSTIDIAANNLEVKDGGITSAKLSPSITFPAGSVTAAARLIAPNTFGTPFTGTGRPTGLNQLVSSITLTSSANNKMIMVGLYGVDSSSNFQRPGGILSHRFTIEAASLPQTTIGYFNITSAGQSPAFAMIYYITSGQDTFTIKLIVDATGASGGWGYGGNFRIWASELG